MPYLFVLFLFLPLIEIYCLIKLGSVFGAGLTIFFVVLTALIGAGLVHRQGISTLTRAQTRLSQAELPAIEMLEGVMILTAGALLLTPGFITDTLGFACLIPPLRQIVISWFIRHRSVQVSSANSASSTSSTKPRQGVVIDAEVIETKD